MVHNLAHVKPEVSIVIVSGKDRVLTAQYVKACPRPCEINITRTSGLGLARHQGIMATNADLILMFDDDLTLGHEIWSFLFSLKDGEFMMARLGEHLSTRVFAIHRKDYLAVGGFDTRIKYIFEDGDFYLRALRSGLNFRVVPEPFYTHVHHDHRIQDYMLLVRLSWEYSRMFVKYGRNVYRNPLNFFLHPFWWKIFPFHFVTKLVGVPYWILRRTASGS